MSSLLGFLCMAASARSSFRLPSPRLAAQEGASTLGLMITSWTHLLALSGSQLQLRAGLKKIVKKKGGGLFPSAAEDTPTSTAVITFVFLPIRASVRGLVHPSVFFPSLPSLLPLPPASFSNTQNLSQNFFFSVESFRSTFARIASKLS